MPGPLCRAGLLRRLEVPAWVTAQPVLGQLTACGTGDQVREQLQSWDRAADIVTILLPPGMPWHNIEATLRAAAPGAGPQMRPSDLSTATAGGRDRSPR
jgi:hypothetical protein